MKTTIGIFPSIRKDGTFALYERYTDAIIAIGALPIVIPHVTEADADTLYALMDKCDGFLFTGGNDIDPALYGMKKWDTCGEITAKRDNFEILAFKYAMASGKSILGICRGCQLINVYFGGSLYQHLPKADQHVSVNGSDSVHKITATEGSILNDLYGEAFAVNSSHHQAVKDLGEGLRATAFWNGEYIEAHEHKTLPIFSVQFHPERMCFAKARTDTVNGADIFKHFIAVCEKYAEK